MSIKIVIANQKGGVGKTTTALALKDILAGIGYKVLLIDCDPQCNASDCCGAVWEDKATLGDLLLDENFNVIQHSSGGDIVSGDPALKEAPVMLTGVAASYKLREAMPVIGKNYDFCILDTGPSLNVLLTNALTAADYVVIPITADRFSAQGLIQLSQTISDVRKYTNPEIKVIGLLLTKHQERINIGKDFLSAIPEYEALLNTKLFSSKIRLTVNVRNAQANKMSLKSYNQDMTAYQDYCAFTNELLERIKHDKQNSSK